MDREYSGANPDIEKPPPSLSDKAKEIIDKANQSQGGGFFGLECPYRIFPDCGIAFGIVTYSLYIIF